MGPGCDLAVFFASLQQSLDRALPGLDGVSRQYLMSDQFVEGVQPALRAQLRLVRATDQLSVEELVRLARELAEVSLATLRSQKRDNSPVEDLRNKVDQIAEQLAATKTEIAETCSDEPMLQVWHTWPLEGSLSSYPTTCA
ncbi:gap-Pol polyprotein [Clonorchis sinensis]|uniref:Gap-Pol polyprotein n=1 Tax=Clonorchis sinensis TaxID=79923 RepID=G7Y5K4_CLOSI|nr:gap-Pol polyprotein [Clonorchis sinensis]